MSRGNPTKLTEEMATVILDAIEAGNYKGTACALVGVHRDTLHNWEQLGAQGKEPFAGFVERLRVAEAKAEVGLLAEIRGARGGSKHDAPDVWTSRAWIMERRFAKRWGLRVKAAVNEELESLLRRLESRLDADTFGKVIDATREDAGEPSDDTRH